MFTSTTRRPFSPETLKHEATFKHGEKLGFPHNTSRQIGAKAIELVNRDAYLNDDPLAHVWTVLESTNRAGQDAQIAAEISADLAERSPDRCHSRSFGYMVVGDDLLSDTGLYMREMLLRSLEVTKVDAINDTLRNYGLLREQVQYEQLSQILDWNTYSAGKIIGFASLCPTIAELDSRTAKANSFKQDRLLASLWFYEKQSLGQLKMHAFSLEHCTLDRLSRTLEQCGLPAVVGINTLDQLARSIDLSACGVAAFKQAYRAVLLNDGVKSSDIEDADTKVAACPEAVELYKKFVYSCAESLSYGVVSARMATLLSEITSMQNGAIHSYLGLKAGDSIGINDGRLLMDFLRSRVLPQYVYGVSPRSTPSHSDATSFAASLSDVVASGKVYDNSCPGSAFGGKTSEALGLADFGIINRQAVIDILSGQVKRGDCLACPVKDTDIFGCGFCKGCHHIWSGEFRASGKMLEVDRVAKIAALRFMKTSMKFGKAALAKLGSRGSKTGTISAPKPQDETMRKGLFGFYW